MTFRRAILVGTIGTVLVAIGVLWVVDRIAEAGRQ